MSIRNWDGCALIENEFGHGYLEHIEVEKPQDHFPLKELRQERVQYSAKKMPIHLDPMNVGRFHS